MHLLPKDQWGSAGAPPGTDLKGVKMLDGKDVGTPPQFLSSHNPDRQPTHVSAPWTGEARAAGDVSSLEHEAAIEKNEILPLGTKWT